MYLKYIHELLAPMFTNTLAKEKLRYPDLAYFSPDNMDILVNNTLKISFQRLINYIVTIWNITFPNL